jgi:hypothetical protein
MASNITRRETLLALTASAVAVNTASPMATVESHVHVFDPDRVPYAPDAPYKPAAYTLEDHLKLVEAAGLAHSIIVHPEPYQDDHRYVEYCLAHEPRPGYFKATCMFDPLKADTPGRMRELADRWPKRIVAKTVSVPDGTGWQKESVVFADPDAFPEIVIPSTVPLPEALPERSVPSRRKVADSAVSSGILAFALPVQCVRIISLASSSRACPPLRQRFCVRCAPSRNP